MNDQVLTQLKVIVERVVRPVRANLSRKRRMREELLEHLGAIYEEELERIDDEQDALNRAERRFGNPKELSEELRGTVSRWDWVLYLLDKLRWEPGESLLHLAGKHVILAFASFAYMLPLMFLVIWIRGRLAEIGMILHVVVVMAVMMSAFSFLFILLTDRLERALYGRNSERSLRRAVLYCLVSLAVFPAFTFLAFWGLLGDLDSSFGHLRIALWIAPAAPLLFVVMARQMADERQEEEWAKLEINE